ncbi:Bromodomain-containing protein [Astathelohania contejeani]|uniref:Bromodomain-containing protein n=1 Tax=Astathelohania contejeani TaxID=164912 RepID=A0ABQ7I0S8_9MICR|nr:Bromodomain-containing protein [Thelohania contejeani]
MPELAHQKFSYKLLADLTDQSEFIDSLTTYPAIFKDIIKTLQNYKPFCLPFLTKVNKKDAPNYYEVILHPIDLETMYQKVDIYTLDTFMDDINLLVNNCVIYNKTGLICEYAYKIKEKAEESIDYYFKNVTDCEENFIPFINETVSIGDKSYDAGLLYNQVIEKIICLCLKNVGFERVELSAIKVFISVVNYKIYYWLKNDEVYRNNDIKNNNS